MGLESVSASEDVIWDLLGLGFFPAVVQYNKNWKVYSVPIYILRLSLN